LRTKALVLYALCIGYFVAGFNVLNIGATDLALLRQADPGITAHTDIFTLKQIGWFFMIVTILCAILGFLKKVNWGFSILTFVLTWWACLYLVSWAQTGYWESVYGFINYGISALILVLVSRLVDPPTIEYQQVMGAPLPLGEPDTKLPRGESQ
jgi:hypothetical protein